MYRKIKYGLLALSALPITLPAQLAAETPHLVVSIVVDQLRGDYLRYFSQTFGEKGFKRLMNDGLSYHSIDYGFPNLGQASSTAAVYTGSYPYYNGITGDSKFEVSKGRATSIVADERYLGNYTADRFSPQALRASTLGDELKIASNGQSRVYALAPHAAEAILAGGQYADGAFWIDDYSGKWATSTYYKEMPSYVDRYNAVEGLGNGSDKQWAQSFNYFVGLPYSTHKEAFLYKFPKSDPYRYIKMKQTALVNTEVTNLAIRLLDYAGFGARLSPDLLTLTYYAGNYLAGPAPEEYSYEVQDIYAQLDRDLERLFDAIDRRVGLRHTLIVLTSTGYYDTLNRLPSGFPPAGQFHPDRCVALLNLYLMALYGHENWVSAYYDRQIFLNRKLAEEKQLRWPELLQSAAEFVSQFSGIQGVATAGQGEDALSGGFRRGLHKSVSGDLFLEIAPGWEIIDEQAGARDPVRDTAILTPLFFLGESVPAGTHLDRTVKAAEIAPTLSYLLRIRPPNACRDLPLPEVVRR
jgi:hypothetical protein